ncbi:MAG: DoxX family protein [Acidimicrobiia bacterium]|nr:DoxX family protein [Acidimicrobiia bacterium]
MIAEPGFSNVVLVARLLLAAPYLVSAIEKSLHFSAALEEFAKARVPAVRFTAIATIVLHLVASVCLIAGWFFSEMAVALALFTLVATVRVHDFWNMEGLQRLERSRVLLANLGLVGGLILLAAVGPGSKVL